MTRQDDETLVERLSGDLPDDVDVVVVGAGAAGCVMAARMSQQRDCRVLLLEAGSSTGLEPVARTPGAAMRLWQGETSWGDSSVPQSSLGGRRVGMPQGRGIGGGSSMNGMAWFHGHPADYDGWAAAGAAGWGWADVQRVFRSIENSDFGDSRWHGSDGPMRVTRTRDVSALALAFLAAGAESGMPVTEDFNGAVREGVGLVRANIQDGQRYSVVDGYLLPALARPNLTMRSRVLVTSIEFDGGRACGVWCVDGDGRRRRVTASRVILSTGALRTPQLLMLSGIGPADHLRQHGIDVLHDLPAVGANLQDHPMLATVWPVIDGSPLWSRISEVDLRAYELLRRGMLASFTQATAKVRTRNELVGPNVQLTLALIGVDDRRQVLSEPALTCAVSLLTPESRGTVRLAAADPAAAPLIDPRYGEAPGDRQQLIEGLHVARQLFQIGALKAATGGIARHPVSWDPQTLDTWLEGRLGSEWHPVGTCRMGTDDAAVVNSANMEVNGVRNLHVVDASLMPTVPRANTHAPTIMIAERAAELIRAQG
jgi:choline dehydrogenase